MTQIHKDIKRVLVDEASIVARSKELGQQISEDYAKQGKNPLLVAVLKGSIPFMAELMKHITLDVEMDFMAVSSYEGTRSIGDVKILKDLDRSIKGRDILLVEDIVDTGRTIDQVVQLLLNKGANEVKIVSLLDKPSRRVLDMNADYIGFTIEDAFVVGYGLDFNEKYRNLPYVGVLKDELYQ
jgi:hypoxanthine phosphoribosyltransferase